MILLTEAVAKLEDAHKNLSPDELARRAEDGTLQRHFVVAWSEPDGVATHVLMNDHAECTLVVELAGVGIHQGGVEPGVVFLVPGVRGRPAYWSRVLEVTPVGVPTS